MTLLLSAGFSAAAAGLFAFVGGKIRSRPAIESMRGAQLLFATWWYALAAVSAIGGIVTAFAAMNITDLPVYLTASYVSFLVLCLALWALLYYLIYLFTGWRKAMVPLTAFYVMYYAAIVYLINVSQPESIAIGRWTATVEYGVELEPWIGPVVLGLLVLPQIGASLALVGLSLRTRDPAQRYRALLVGSSILVWFSSSFVASITDVGPTDLWQVGSRILGLLAAYAVLVAYVPPHWVRVRLGIETGTAPQRIGGA